MLSGSSTDTVTPVHSGRGVSVYEGLQYDIVAISHHKAVPSVSVLASHTDPAERLIAVVSIALCRLWGADGPNRPGVAGRSVRPRVSVGCRNQRWS